MFIGRGFQPQVPAQPHIPHLKEGVFRARIDKAPECPMVFRDGALTHRADETRFKGDAMEKLFNRLWGVKEVVALSVAISVVPEVSPVTADLVATSCNEIGAWISHIPEVHSEAMEVFNSMEKFTHFDPGLQRQAIDKVRTAVSKFAHDHLYRTDAPSGDTREPAKPRDFAADRQAFVFELKHTSFADLAAKSASAVMAPS